MKDKYKILQNSDGGGWCPKVVQVTSKLSELCRDTPTSSIVMSENDLDQAFIGS